MKNIQGKPLFYFIRQLAMLVHLSFSVAKPARSLSCPFVLSFSFSTDKRGSECGGQPSPGDFSLLETSKPPSSSDKLAKSIEG